MMFNDLSGLDAAKEKTAMSEKTNLLETGLSLLCEVMHADNATVLLKTQAVIAEIRNRILYCGWKKADFAKRAQDEAHAKEMDKQERAYNEARMVKLVEAITADPTMRLELSVRDWVQSKKDANLSSVGYDVVRIMFRGELNSEGIPIYSARYDGTHNTYKAAAYRWAIADLDSFWKSLHNTGDKDTFASDINAFMKDERKAASKSTTSGNSESDEESRSTVAADAPEDIREAANALDSLRNFVLQNAATLSGSDALANVTEGSHELSRMVQAFVRDALESAKTDAA